MPQTGATEATRHPIAESIHQTRKRCNHIYFVCMTTTRQFTSRSCGSCAAPSFPATLSRNPSIRHRFTMQLHTTVTHVTKLRLLRDAEDLGQAVVELAEQLRGLDGHAAQQVVQGLRVEERLQRQRLADETVRTKRKRKKASNGNKQSTAASKG